MASKTVYNIEFEPTDEERWRELARRTLKLADLESLVSYSDDGIRIEPIYRRASAQHSLRADPERPWRIVQRVDDPDPAAANRQAREDIANGANGLAIVFAGAPNAFGHGLPAEREALHAVLEELPLDRMHLRIDPHPASRASIDWIIDLYGARRVSPEAMSFSFGFDPAAILAGTGRLHMSVEALQASLPQSLGHFFALDLPGILMEADGRVYHNAGATAAQELGAMLASAVWLLRMFEEARQPLVYAANHIGFSLAVDQDQFETIAKVRALRRLWSRIQEVCSSEPQPTVIHAETSWRMLAGDDMETNILRNTIAAFSAGVGGADSLSILGHDLPIGLPGSHSRRIARNTQLILQQESHLGFVSDPAAGSGGLEAMTEALCGKAWEQFQSIEAAGGIFSVLQSGWLQDRIEASASSRAARYADGSLKLVGSNCFLPPDGQSVSPGEIPASTPDSGEPLQTRPLVARRIEQADGATK